jgi:hypothetical protein
MIRLATRKNADVSLDEVNYLYLFRIKQETRSFLPHHPSHDGAHCAPASLQPSGTMHPLLDGCFILRAPTVARSAGRTRLLNVPPHSLLRLFCMFTEGWQGIVPRVHGVSLPEDQCVNGVCMGADRFLSPTHRHIIKVI